MSKPYLIQPYYKNGVACTLQRYANFGWIDESLRFILPNLPVGHRHYEVSHSFYAEMEDLLRVNMLYHWMVGDFGPIDRPVVRRTDVERIYQSLCLKKPKRFGKTFIYEFFPRAPLLIKKEHAFWVQMKDGKPVDFMKYIE